MTAPLWESGHLYLPGDIVQPITAPATTPVAITNPGFETGDDTGWDLGTATAVSSADKFTGTYSIEFTGTGGITDTLQDTASAVQVGQSITARVMYQQGAASAGHNGGRVLLAFYTSGMVLIGTPSLGNVVDSGSGGAWGQSVVTAVAPDTAAFVKLGIRVNRTNGSPSWADDFSWNHVAQAPAGLVFKAVQPAAGMSGTSEPAWPNTVGLTVVDNEVTWEAIAATRVEWTASPILVSGATEPTWPTQIGEFVADGSIKWEAFSRRVEDENCPNSKIVAIVGSKVFAAERDIARFCATANPLDWTTERDAGYLPLGLQQANANDFNTGVFNQYRSNLVAFNASSFQNWQADPDPAAMALLDQMDGVGSTWQQAAQPVANDLFYLAALGVRTVGIAGGSTNLQAGDVGMPVDPLVKGAVRVAVANSSAVRSTYYPSSGQYWLAFANYPPALPSITGDVPDGFVGNTGAGAYTVTGGVLPYSDITVLSGTAPPGLTINPDGTYTYDFTTPGSYSWTVGGVDADGTPFSTPDSAVVAPSTFSRWWLTYTNNIGDQNSIWYATSPLGPWGDIAIREPNINATLGMRWSGSRMAILGDSQVESLAPSELPGTGTVVPTVTTPPTLPAGDERWAMVGGVLFTLGAVAYATSTDGGLTWANHTSPGGNPLQAVSRLSSGRWLAFTSGGVFGDFWYSDESVPNAWTVASNNSSASSPLYEMCSFGTGAFHLDNGGGIRRTVDGTAWTYSATGGLPAGAPSSTFSSTDGAGVWMVSYGATDGLYRATNNAMTGGFSLVAMPVTVAGVRYLTYASGWFVGLFVGGIACASNNAGVSWTQAALPTTPPDQVSGNPNITFAVAP